MKTLQGRKSLRDSIFQASCQVLGKEGTKLLFKLYDLTALTSLVSLREP